MRSQYIPVYPDTMPGDGDLCFAFRASSLYGGATVVKAVANTGVAGTLDLALVNYGTAGTVAGGTIAHMSGGTATVWAADTPQALTLATDANIYVAPGEYVFLKKIEAAAGNDLTADACVMIEIVEGVVTQS